MADGDRTGKDPASINPGGDALILEQEVLEEIVRTGQVRGVKIDKHIIQEAQKRLVLLRLVTAEYLNRRIDHMNRSMDQMLQEVKERNAQNEGPAE